MSIQIFRRALQLKELRRFNDALTLLEDLIQDVDFSLEAWEEIADCYIQLNELSKAEIAIKNAVKLEPELHGPRSTLAYIKHLQGNTRKARILLLDILSEDPTNFRAKYLLAQVYLSTRNLNKVRGLLESLEVELPNNSDVKSLKIRYHALKNDKASFNKELNAKLYHDPEDIDALTLKAYAYIDEELFQQAEEVAIQVLSIDPMNKLAKEALLVCRKNNNALLRFFAGRSFNIYTIEWTFGRVILAIICFKGFLLWGGFFILYLLITWVGGVAYNSYLRLTSMGKLLLTKQQIHQSNFLLMILGLIILFWIISRFSDDIIYDKISILLIPILFIGISFFQLTSRTKKIIFSICSILMGGILYLGFLGDDTFSIIVASSFVVLSHGILFSFRAIGE